MSTRPVLTPWHPFGRGARRVNRHPYAEMEVFPTAAGWRWSVQRIVPATGSFELIADGIEAKQTDAQARAMDCLRGLR